MNTSTIPDRTSFATMMNGKPTDLLLLSKGRLQAGICNYGARWIFMQVPGRQGKQVNVLSGPLAVEECSMPAYVYHGATTGRYANRIAHGRFSLNNREYVLSVNLGAHHLHGGFNGLHHVVWDILEQTNDSVLLHHFSPDGTEGYPGNVSLNVRYTLTDDAALRIDYTATTDQPTILNLTNHAYFNLNGGGSILRHLFTIASDYITPVDAALIPTGTFLPVVNTPFDFRKPVAIGEQLCQPHPQFSLAGTYDHNFVLRQNQGQASVRAAHVQGDKSGIEMEVWTTEPGMQFYVQTEADKKDPMFYHRNSFCLETQHFPDTPNHLRFPSVELNPGDLYQSTTSYRFLL